jgi:formamidase
MHNRWHPDLEPIATVAPGEELRLETEDGLAGQLGPDSSHEDAGSLDLGLGHPLTGPVRVEGAEPGDVLEVEFVAYEPPVFGFTAVIPGFGYLADLFPDPHLVKWEIEGGRARSSELPGISVSEATFAGVAGIAPSHETRERIRAREEELRGRGGAVADDLPETAAPPLAASGLRTIPPRELGGNLDVPQLVAGSRLLLRVDVPGALFSVGDLHFAQGEGEVCGTGVEIAGAVTLRFGLRKQPTWRPEFPAFETPGLPARPAFAATGISVDEAGRNESLDLSLATRRALLAMLDHLTLERGFGREAAYALMSVAVDLRISEVVDVPNPVVSALLPLDIFDS